MWGQGLPDTPRRPPRRRSAAGPGRPVAAATQGNPASASDPRRRRVEMVELLNYRSSHR
jgi:hypothetical protein